MPITINIIYFSLLNVITSSQTDDCAVRVFGSVLQLRPVDHNDGRQNLPATEDHGILQHLSEVFQVDLARYVVFDRQVKFNEVYQLILTMTYKYNLISNIIVIIIIIYNFILNIS